MNLGRRAADIGFSLQRERPGAAVNFQQAIQSGFANYATFRSRASRSEFWYWQLFLVVAGLVAELFDVGIGVRGAPLSGLFCLVTLVPNIAIYVRRLHDTDRSGWWLLLFFVPLIGAIVLIVWLCTKGSHGYNRFGADPLPPEPGQRHRVRQAQT
jgi:uncharacterized membrane protein YhaH (DUF805 family)